LRLLLDEHYSPEIATRLAEAGHDVTAVKGDAALEGLSDDALLSAAAQQGRALVTNNVGDFVALESEWLARGDQHLGVVYTSDASMPRSRHTIGLYVERLTELLDTNEGDGAMRGRSEWLSPPES